MNKIRYIHQLIETDNLKLALKELSEFYQMVDSNDYSNEIILITNKLMSLEKDKIKDVIDRNSYQIEKSKIMEAILTLAGNVENDPLISKETMAKKSQVSTMSGDNFTANNNKGQIIKDSNNVRIFNDRKSIFYVIAVVLIFVIGAVIYLPKIKDFIGLTAEQVEVPEMSEADKITHNEISNQIEDVYFKLVNMTLSKVEDPPLYNIDIGAAVKLTMVGEILIPLGYTNKTFNIEPKNIQISKLDNKIAQVNYNIHIVNDNGEKVFYNQMEMKKIAGKWRLDAKKLLPEFNK